MSGSDDDDSDAFSGGFEGEGGPGHSSDLDDDVRGRGGSNEEADLGENVGGFGADTGDDESGGEMQGESVGVEGLEMEGDVGHAQMR